MLTRLSTAIAALLVAVWLGYHGLGLILFATNANAAYTTTDLAEVVGTVAEHADELVRPGDRYYVAGGLALVAAVAFAVAGVRVVFRVAGQRSQHIDEDRIRFAGHHRHGA